MGMSGSHISPHMMAAAVHNEDILVYKNSPNSCSALICTHHSNFGNLSTILKTARHKIMKDVRIFELKCCSFEYGAYRGCRQLSHPLIFFAISHADASCQNNF